MIGAVPVIFFINILEIVFKAVMKKIKENFSDKSSLELVRTLARAASDKKAQDLVILDVRGISSFADYFLIMSGRSVRHVQGLANAVDEAVGSKRLKAANTEGLSDGHWVLIDYNDVVVHIFYDQTRKFYDLEGLWHDAGRLTEKDLEKEVNTA